MKQESIYGHYTWTNRYGEAIFLKDMDLDYLSNATTWLIRSGLNAKDGLLRKDWLNVFKGEIDYRMNNKPKQIEQDYEIY